MALEARIVRSLYEGSWPGERGLYVFVSISLSLSLSLFFSLSLSLFAVEYDQPYSGIIAEIWSIFLLHFILISLLGDQKR